MGNICTICCCCGTDEDKDNPNGLRDPLVPDPPDPRGAGHVGPRTWNWNVASRRDEGLPPLAPPPVPRTPRHNRSRRKGMYFAPGTLESRGYESWKKANAYLLNYHRLSYEATMRALQEDVQIETEAAADEARMVC